MAADVQRVLGRPEVVDALRAVSGFVKDGEVGGETIGELLVVVVVVGVPAGKSGDLLALARVQVLKSYSTLFRPGNTLEFA